MPSDTAIATKTCCACGADVTGQPRMKDSQSRYWCMPCGEADQRRKQITATHATCAGCRQNFPKGKLDKDGEYFFCKGCLKKRSRAASVAASRGSAPATVPMTSSSHGSSAMAASSAGGDRRRVMLMAGVLLALLIAALLFNFVFTG